jgi:acetyl coenzyme A synthetase (ADP forming)-like protein
MHTVSGPLPAAEEIGTPRVVLRDGSVATIRRADAGDRAALREFFHRLSPESRRNRFFTETEPSTALIDRFCDTSDPGRCVTLLALRYVSDALQPIAVGTYIATTPRIAEVAFAVDDAFHGLGLGTMLLERLAALAVQEGFERFQATTLGDNTAMLEVFRESGFEIRAKSAAGCVDVQLSLASSDRAVARAEERHRLATAASLQPLMQPRAVAVVGASRDVTSIGRRVFDAIRTGGFRGSVFPVNPAADSLDGARCFGSVRDLPPGVDLAVIAVPREKVLGVVDDCAAAHIPGVVLITAGFAEAGDSGRALQRQILERVRGYGMRMVGPNCMGLLNANAHVRLNASFSALMPAPGQVGLSSQSGALGLAILELAARRHVGLSTFISVGNKADVSGNDLLQYWESDPNTSVILLYLESFGNPRRFARLARRIGRSKPIVAIKAGRTRAGSRAARSHTAALTADDSAVAALFQQSGVIRAETIDEMFDVAACLDAQPLPAGRRVAVITNAGGPGILAVDACEANGLAVVEFSAGTAARLAEFLPPEASLRNPVDMVASAGPDQYRRTIETVLSSSDADALIVVFTPVDPRGATDIVEAIRDGIAAGRAAGATAKPVLLCMMADGGHVEPLQVGGERVPAYAFPENAARALAKIAAYAEWRAQPPGLFWGFDDIRSGEARSVCREAITTRGGGWLTAEETTRVLNAFGLPLVPTIVTRTADDAAAVARVVGFPVVAKLQAPNVIHKSDVGGVKLGLRSENEVREAFADLAQRTRDGGVADADAAVVIQPMIDGGVETIVGATEDPVFGPLVAFGLGGIHVEVLHDVGCRLAPLTDRDADALLHGIRGFKVLEGYRGRPPADVDALRDLLLRIGRLAEELPEVVELDLNPVIALPPGQGCRIVDARIKVGAR